MSQISISQPILGRFEHFLQLICTTDILTLSAASFCTPPYRIVQRLPWPACVTSVTEMSTWKRKDTEISEFGIMCEREGGPIEHLYQHKQRVSYISNNMKRHAAIPD